MRKVFSKMVAVLICGIMIISFAACHNENNDNSPKGQVEPTNVIEATDEPGTDPIPEVTPEPVVVDPTKEPEPEPEIIVEVIDSNSTVYKNDAGSIWTENFVTIQNNGEVPAYIGTVTLDLEKESGLYVSTIGFLSAYPNILLPGEKAVVYGRTALYADPEVKSLVVKPSFDTAKPESDIVRYEVCDEKVTTSDDGKIIVVGTVKNTTDKDSSLYYVVANFYNKSGHVIGQLIDSVTLVLEAGNTANFKAAGGLPIDIDIADIDHVEMFAFPYMSQIIEP